MAIKLASRVLSAIRAKMQGRVKLIHILLEAVIVLLSGLVFFPLSKTTQHFDQNCLLNSNIYIKSHSNKSISLDPTKTVYGDIDDCNLTTFFNVVAFLHGIIWIWFFFHLEQLATSDGSSSNLLLPTLVTHFVLFICAIVCSVKIGNGFSSWCDHIEENNKDILSISMSCKEYESLSWTEDRAKFYTYNLMALISSWIMVGFILIFLVMTCVHIYWDFQETFLDKHNKRQLETSGFVDNGVGILNKMATSYNSTDGFYTDSLEGDSYEAGGAAGGAAGDGLGGSVGNVHSKTNKNDPDDPMEMIVNATVHTPEDSPTPDVQADAAAGLRSRGNAVSKQ